MSDDCRTVVAQRIVDFLRRTYPANTAINVAADTGIASETVQKMLDRVSAPNIINYSRLWFAYGPEFLVAAHPRAPKWLDEARRAESARKLDAQIAALQKQRARL